MNCCKYHSGLLKSKLLIERKTRVSDGMGGFTETWATEGVVWAQWKALNGAERYHAMRLGSEPRAKAVIRFRGDSYGAPYYSGRDRVLHKGRYWNIESVIDPDDRQEWLELNLVEGQPS